MICPDPNEFAALLAGTLDEQARGAMEAHVDTCDRCRALVVSMFRGDGPRGEAPPFGERYAVEGELGRGGMGVVYRAFDRVLDAHIALKVIAKDAHPLGHEAAIAQLKREVLLARRVSHPRVCRLHDVGVHEDAIFLTMELVEGMTLATWLRVGERDATSIRGVLIQVLEALEGLHSAEVVHRDVKPTNVMLTSSPALAAKCAPDVKLLDFGLAARIGERDGLAVGTPGYCAPEQARGEVAQCTADVFSVGRLGLRLLARTPGEPGLVTLLERASHPLVAQRFSSARAMREAILSLPAEHHRGAARGAFAEDQARLGVVIGVRGHVPHDASMLGWTRHIEDEDVTLFVSGVEGDMVPMEDALRLALRLRPEVFSASLAAGRIERGKEGLSGEALATAKRLLEVAASGVVVARAQVPATDRLHIEIISTDLADVLEVDAEAPLRAHALVLETESMRRLDALLERTHEALSWVEVVGPPGIGKSTLIKALGARPRSGTTLLVHSASRTPLALLSQLLRSVLLDGASLASPVARRHALLQYIAKLACPSHAAVEVASLVDVAAGFRARDVHLDRLQIGLTALVDGWLAEGPVSLLIDDAAQWDGESLELLRRVLIARQHCPLRVVLSGRSGEPDEAWLASFRVAPAACMRLDVVGLEASDARALAAYTSPLLDAASLTSCVESAAGNPLWVLSAATLLSQGVDPQRATSLQGLVQMRMDRLAARERRVLKEASVFPAGFDAEALQSLIENDVEGVLAVLLRERLLEFDQETHRLTFASPVVRETACSLLGTHERTTLHARCAQHADATHDVWSAAWHWHEAGDALRASERATSALRMAASQGHSSRVLEAFSLIDSARISAAQHVENVLDAARALHYLGRHEERMRLLVSARAGLEDARALARVERAISYAASRLGDREGALLHAEHAVAAASADPSQSELPDAWACHAMQAAMTGALERARASIAQAMAPTLVACSNETRMHVHDANGLIQTMSGRLSLALRSYQAAIAACDAGGLVREACSARANGADLLLRVGRLEEAARALRGAMATSDALGNITARDYAQLNLSYACMELGEVGEAHALLARLRERTVRGEGDARLRLGTLLYQARAYLIEGSLVGAQLALEEADTLLEAAPDLEATMWITRARMLWLAGDEHVTRQAVDRADAHLGAHGGSTEDEAWLDVVRLSLALEEGARTSACDAARARREARLAGLDAADREGALSLSGERALAELLCPARANE